MSYLVLARKWRPSKFSEVIGQPHVTQTLLNGLKQKRLAHAYLFSGPRGVGKTTTARLLARAINCKNNKGILEQADKVDSKAMPSGFNGEPCNECELCVAALEGRAIDVIEIDAASNTGVEDIRVLRENVTYTPIEGVAKVYVIDEVHMLSTNAFNALLKTLEEPPSHAYFFLATTSPQKVPSTILSRCQRFDFRRVTAAEIRNHLESILKIEGIEYEIDALDIIARRADGSIRDSLSLLDQIIAFAGGRVFREDVVEIAGEVRWDLYFRALELGLSHSIAEAFRLDDELARNAIDPQDYLAGLQAHIVNVLQVKAVGLDRVDIPIDSKSDFEAISEKFGEPDLIRMLNLASQAEVDVRRNFNPRGRLQLLLLKYASLDRSIDITELLERMGKGKDTAKITATATVRSPVNADSKVKSDTAPVKGDKLPVKPTATEKKPDDTTISKTDNSVNTTAQTQGDVLKKAQSHWDEICDLVAETQNSSGRMIKNGGFPVDYANGILKINFIDRLHLDRANACKTTLQKALVERVGSVSLNFAIGEVPKREISDDMDSEPELKLLKDYLNARIID